MKKLYILLILIICLTFSFSTVTQCRELKNDKSQDVKSNNEDINSDEANNNGVQNNEPQNDGLQNNQPQTDTPKDNELPGNKFTRTSDSTGSLSELQIETIDETCQECFTNYKVDLALLSVTSEEYEDEDLYAPALKYYEENNCGYGDSRDCIIFVCDTASKKAAYYEFGNVHGKVPESYYEFAAKAALGYKESNGMFGVLYAGGRFIFRYLENMAESNAKVEANADEAETNIDEADVNVTAQTDVEKEAAETETDTDVKGTKNGTENNSSDGFIPHHDENAPRVTDRADIFTDEEEAAMEERLNALRDEICCDIVIYTDVTANGKDHKYVAADFFDYGGYGWGDDYEGACLFICMDPNDRGWWIANNGPKTMKLYTEDIANLMDDVLYDYMVAGKYAEGVNDWITNYATLYTKGYPFAPSWLPDEGEETLRTHNPNVPRIDDAGKALSEWQISELTTAAKGLSDKYNLDIVAHTTRYDAGMDIEEYAKKYYECCGYGFGDNYDGIALIIFLNKRGYYRDAMIYASGKGNDKLTEVNEDRLLGYFSDKADYSDDIYGGLKIYLDKLGHMEKTGRVPRSTMYWSFIGITGLILGAIFANISLNRAKKKMDTPALSLNADLYLVDGSLSVTGNDRFLSSSTTTTYSPVHKSTYSGSSSSSSSSHRSSYSSSYRSSSGRTHSGSGRRF